MQKRREHARLRSERCGEVRFQSPSGPAVIDCFILEMSAEGALLHCSTNFGIPSDFTLTVSGIAIHDCVVKWKSQGQLAVKFV
jgi:hypothetical protein